MTAAEFAREVVIPTVEEFRDDRTSRRRAYLAAVVVYHLRDHLAEALAPVTGDPKQDRREVEAAAGRVDDAVRTALPGQAFDVVRGICNGSKHATTRALHAVPFTVGADWERPAARAGQAMAGMSRAGDGAGGREIFHGGQRLDLYHAVQATLSTFLALYPVELTGCPFTPYPRAY